MLRLAALLALSCSAAFAAPAGGKISGCDISSAKLTLPEGQTVIADPTGTPLYISLGVGTQNYTCSTAGTYALVFSIFIDNSGLI